MFIEPERALGKWFDFAKLSGICSVISFTYSSIFFCKNEHSTEAIQILDGEILFFFMILKLYYLILKSSRILL